MLVPAVAGRRSAEAGMEFFCAAGLVTAGAQVAFAPARRGVAGMASFSLLLLLWHDLLCGGGTFMAYQMDALMLDATPLAVKRCFKLQFRRCARLGQ